MVRPRLWHSMWNEKSYSTSLNLCIVLYTSTLDMILHERPDASKTSQTGILVIQLSCFNSKKLCNPLLQAKTWSAVTGGAFQCFSCALWELLVVSESLGSLGKPLLTLSGHEDWLDSYPPWQFKASANKIWHAAKAAGTRSWTRWTFLQMKISTI